MNKVTNENLLCQTAHCGGHTLSCLPHDEVVACWYYQLSPIAGVVASFLVRVAVCAHPVRYTLIEHTPLTAAKMLHHSMRL